MATTSPRFRLAPRPSPPEGTSAPTVSAYLFATDVRAPRRRRPVDALVLLASIAGLGALWWAADLGRLPADERVVLNLTSGLLRSLAWVLYTLCGLYALGLVSATVVRAGASRGIVRDLAVTVIGVTVFSLVVARSINGFWPDVLPEVFDHTDAPTFPGFRLAIVAAVVSVLGPHVALPVRRLGRRVVITCVTATLLLGFTPLSGALASLLLAAAVVAAVRVSFGSPAGLPPVGRLRHTLARLGVEVDELAYDSDQRGGVGRVSATVDGRRVTVKVYGRDAADAERAERIWRAMWYRRAGASPGAGRLRQVEHEALGLLLASRQGVDVGELIAAGEEDGGDALLVVERPAGRPIGTVEDLRSDELAAVWAMLGRLHDRRFAHGNIGPESVLVGDGAAALVELQDCSLSAENQQLGSDVASLLVTTAAIVGAERAVAAAVEAWPTERLDSSLPYLQMRALPWAARRWVDERDVDVDAVRTTLVERLGVEVPDLVELRRVTWGGVVMVLFAIIAANAIISQIAEIGADALVEELRNASPGWLVAAFALKLSGYLASWVSMQAVLTERVPVGPTVLLQSAKGFIGLVVPSTVGRVAMDVRFLQKLGTPTSVALTQGPLISMVGFLVEVLLLLLTAGAVAAATDTSADDITRLASGGLILAALAVALVAAAVVLTVPRLRSKVVPPVREAIASVRDVVASPQRMAQVFAGELLDRIVNALALGAVVIAFGQSLALGELVFVTVGVGLLSGLAPVPGGVAVAEALLTGLLTSAGLPPDLSFAIAITYRLLTSYLPPALGVFSWRYLTAAGYL